MDPGLLLKKPIMEKRNHSRVWDAWRTRLVMESLQCCNPMRKSSWTTKAPVNRHLISSMTTTTSSMWVESFWGKSKLGPDMCSDPTWCFKLAKPGENNSWLSKREIVDCENKGWLLGFLMTLSCPPTLQPVSCGMWSLRRNPSGGTPAEEGVAIKKIKVETGDQCSEADISGLPKPNFSWNLDGVAVCSFTPSN